METEDQWQRLSECLLTDVKEWRKAHPRATLREIEEEVQSRMSRLEAQLIQDLAQESTQQHWAGAPIDQRPACPVCHRPLHARGKRARTLQGKGGQLIKLTREYGTCPDCGTGLFPLDEELGLLPGHLTPKAQDHLAHLGSWMPFERASQMLYALLGIQVSEPSVRRGTQKAGARYQARQTAQCQEPAPEGAGGKRQAISLDGAYVPLIKGQWAEVRTLAIGEVKQEPGKTEGHVHTHDLSFFSRMIEADRFAELAEGELRRRGVSQTPAVCAVTDGAPWIQHFIDLHCHDAVRILDLPHVIEHAGVLADALSHAGVLMPEHAAQRCAEVLKRRGPTLLWRWCCRLPDTIKEREAIQAQLEYIRKRLDLMQYPTYLRQGWPIGSGMVESANKVVVQARLKGAGMHWSPHHVNSMLALRTAVCNQRWDEAWQEGIREHANQRTLMRHQRAQVRVRTLFFPLLFWFARLRPTAVASPPSPPPISRASERAATLPGSSCPSAHHPWKRMPVCRPKPSAKN